ncbi:MAG: flagellar assembly protein FliW [Polyangiaceae bacterium]|nr:flagellar assembly protein FliW [Polyangiaceae bacterium]
MKIDSTRFGSIDIDPEAMIRFPNGPVGFPNERSFVLLRRSDDSPLAWLQSTTSPELAFPVVSAHALGHDYPDVDPSPSVEEAGIAGGAGELAILVVLAAAPGAPATVNLLAPIVVNVTTRAAAQIFLRDSRYRARELFALAPLDAPESAAGNVAPPQAEPALAVGA